MLDQQDFPYEGNLLAQHDIHFPIWSKQKLYMSIVLNCWPNEAPKYF